MYPYCDGNRIESPISYMYPAYHGRAFFAAYVEARLGTLSRLLADASSGIRLPEGMAAAAKQACRLEDAAGTLLFPLFRRAAAHARITAAGDGGGRDPVSPPLAGGAPAAVESLEVLDSLLRVFPSRPRVRNDWLSFFASRFEVRKLLHEKYVFPGGGSGGFDNPAVYSRCALLLAGSCHLDADLRLGNALLKLNDLLCSLADRLEGASAGMTICSLLLETSCMDRVLSSLRARHDS